MLLDKVTDSSNSMVQERYVTVSAHKKTPEEARTFFDRVMNDVTTRLNHLDSHCEELDAVERLRVLHDFYRVGEEARVSYRPAGVHENRTFLQGHHLPGQHGVSEGSLHPGR